MPISRTTVLRLAMAGITIFGVGTACSPDSKGAEPKKASTTNSKSSNSRATLPPTTTSTTTTTVALTPEQAAVAQAVEDAHKEAALLAPGKTRLECKTLQRVEPISELFIEQNPGQTKDSIKASRLSRKNAVYGVDAAESNTDPINIPSSREDLVSLRPQLIAGKIDAVYLSLSGSVTISFVNPSGYKATIAVDAWIDEDGRLATVAPDDPITLGLLESGDLFSALVSPQLSEKTFDTNNPVVAVKETLTIVPGTLISPNLQERNGYIGNAVPGFTGTSFDEAHDFLISVATEGSASKGPFRMITAPDTDQMLCSVAP